MSTAINKIYGAMLRMLNKIIAVVKNMIARIPGIRKDWYYEQYQNQILNQEEGQHEAY